MDEKSELKAQANQGAVTKSEPSRMQHSGNVQPPPPDVKNGQPPPKTT